MKQRKTEIELKTEIVKVRFSKADKVRIKEEARIAGLTSAELIRRRSAGESVLALSDLTLLAELRRQGGLLKKIHLDSGGIYSDLTAAAINEIRLFIRSLANDR